MHLFNYSITQFFFLGFILLGWSCTKSNTTTVSSGVSQDTFQENHFLFQKKNIFDFGLSKTKRVVLTYDDGPFPKATIPLLDLLEKENVKATFFMVGQQIKGREAILARMKSSGHILANHSYDHADLRKEKFVITPAELIEEIRRPHLAMQKYIMDQPYWYFRAPYGAWLGGHQNPLNQELSLKKYIGPVLWDVGTKTTSKSGQRPTTADDILTAADWDCWQNNPQKNIQPITPEVCAAGYYKEIIAKGGGVVLLHDLNPKTVQLSALLIKWLKKDGYKFENLDKIESLKKYKDTVL